MKLSKLLNTLMILICVVGIAVTGCDSLINRIIPADISPHTTAYAGADPNHIYNLYEAKRLMDDVLILHRENLLELERGIEDENNAHKDARNFLDASITEAEQFKETVIGDDNNPLSISGLLFMMTGGLVGRSFFKRPGDLSPDEAKAKGAAV